MNPKLLTSRVLDLLRGPVTWDAFSRFLNEAKMSSSEIPQLYGTPEFIALAVKHGLFASGSVLPWPPP